MPSFDIVSKVESHEVANAIDQCTREITNRFDFKGVKAVFELEENEITLKAPSDFQLQQMLEILRAKMVKRNVDTTSLKIEDPETNLSEARQKITIQQGIESEIAKKITKFIKSSGTKVQPAIEGDKIRVSGKKRDDLQEIIALLKKESFGLPLQFENFRD
jgi:uncharacterized protein YajQ (UPF0234 family)